MVTLTLYIDVHRLLKFWLFYLFRDWHWRCAFLSFLKFPVKRGPNIHCPTAGLGLYMSTQLLIGLPCAHNHVFLPPNFFHTPIPKKTAPPLPQGSLTGHLLKIIIKTTATAILQLCYRVSQIKYWWINDHAITSRGNFRCRHLGLGQAGGLVC